MKKTQLSDAQIKYLDAHYGRVKNAVISERLGIPNTTLRRIASKRGLTAGKHGGPRDHTNGITVGSASSGGRSWNDTCADLRRQLGVQKGVRA
jgi:hypothetical protein